MDAGIHKKRISVRNVELKYQTLLKITNL